jgi:hypothetical protein
LRLHRVIHSYGRLLQEIGRGEKQIQATLREMGPGFLNDKAGSPTATFGAAIWYSLSIE